MIDVVLSESIRLLRARSACSSVDVFFLGGGEKDFLSVFIYAVLCILRQTGVTEGELSVLGGSCMYSIIMTLFKM